MQYVSPVAGFARRAFVSLPFVVLLLATGGALYVSAQTPAPASAPAASQAQARLAEEDRLARASWLPTAQATRADRVAWWRQARFGMFIHWGVYSGLGGEWQGEPVKGYAEHIMRIKRIPRQTYLDQVAHAFNPTGFDADAWATLARRAGMKYLVITSKHHDGFAMFDSQASAYNIVKETPFKRDPMKELREACQRQGIKFGFYYSHAFDWEHPEAPGNDWDYDNPGGDKQLHGGLRWYEQPENAGLLTRDEDYVAKKAIPQIKELVAKYHPDILWFDTPTKQPPYLNLRILNALRTVDPTVVVNSRVLQGEHQYSDYLSTADRPAEFRPVQGDWEGIPTTNESYGYHKSDRSHKPASHFVRLLAKAASKGGNLMLNIGPMGDGHIDPADVTILEGIGTWLDANAESIYGTSRSPLPVQQWGAITSSGVDTPSAASSGVPQAPGSRPASAGAKTAGASAGGIRAAAEPAHVVGTPTTPAASAGAPAGHAAMHAAPTASRLYLHVFDWPTDGSLVVAGLQSNIRKAWLLADKKQQALGVRRVNADDVAIVVPKGAADPVDTVIVAELEGPVRADSALLLRSRGETLLHVFDGQLAGEGARYDDGKANKDCVTDWSGSGATVSWDVRVAEPIRVAVAADYAAGDGTGGTFEVRIGDQRLSATVERTGGDQQFVRREMGTVALQPGHYRVTVAPTRVDGKLMRLRGLRWAPASPATAAP